MTQEKLKKLDDRNNTIEYFYNYAERLQRIYKAAFIAKNLKMATIKVENQNKHYVVFIIEESPINKYEVFVDNLWRIGEVVEIFNIHEFSKFNGSNVTFSN